MRLDAKIPWEHNGGQINVGRDPVFILAFRSEGNIKPLSCLSIYGGRDTTRLQRVSLAFLPLVSSQSQCHCVTITF